jgi:hypothetical protein
MKKVLMSIKSNLPMIGTIIVICSILIVMMCYAEKSRKEMQKGDADVCTTISMTSTGAIYTTSSTTTGDRKIETTTTTTARTTRKSTTTTTTTPMIVSVNEIVTEMPTEMPTEQQIPEPITDTYDEQEAQITQSEQSYQETLAYSESDAVLLAQLINKEASATWEGKIAVGNCVINRANINGISISDVIFQKGQFTTAYSLGYYSDTDYQAAVQVLTYGSSDTRIYFFDGNHGGVNFFYDSYHNYLYAA